MVGQWGAGEAEAGLGVLAQGVFRLQLSAEPPSAFDGQDRVSGERRGKRCASRPRLPEEPSPLEAVGQHFLDEALAGADCLLATKLDEGVASGDVQDFEERCGCAMASVLSCSGGKD